MIRFGVILGLVLGLFISVNVNAASYKEKSRKHVEYVGKIYSYNEAGMLWIGMTTGDKDILLGAAYEFGDNKCMRNSEEKGIKVKISGDLVTYADKRMGSSMDPKTVKCFNLDNKKEIKIIGTIDWYDHGGTITPLDNRNTNYYIGSLKDINKKAKKCVDVADDVVVEITGILIKEGEFEPRTIRCKTIKK